MRNIVIIAASLAILCVGVVGTMYIFDVRTFDESLELLFKILGAILLLGACAALISILLKGSDNNTEG